MACDFLLSRHEIIRKRGISIQTRFDSWNVTSSYFDWQSFVQFYFSQSELFILGKFVQQFRPTFCIFVDCTAMSPRDSLSRNAFIYSITNNITGPRSLIAFIRMVSL